MAACRAWQAGVRAQRAGSPNGLNEGLEQALRGFVRSPLRGTSVISRAPRWNVR